MLVGTVNKECPECNTDLELSLELALKRPIGQVAGICVQCGKTSTFNIIKELTQAITEKDERHRPDKILGSFERLKSEMDIDMVKRLVSNNHYRNGRHNKDGSVGTIDITPGQLRDTIAHAILQTIESLGMEE